MQRIIAPIVAVMLALSVVESAVAQQPNRLVCHKTADVTKHLKSKYGESPVALGMQLNGNLLEVYASEEGTWTAVTISPNGMSCVVAAGDGWEQLSPPISGDQT